MDDGAGLSSAHRRLASDLAALLSQDRDGVDVAAIARAARGSGLLRASELQVLDRRGRLPAWLLEELGLHSSYPVSGSFTVAPAAAGKRWPLAPPIALNRVELPRIFSIRDAATPDVQVISGADAELLLNTRSKACFLPDGYVPALTDEDNLWAWGLLKDRPAVRLSGRTLVLYVEGSQLLSHWLLDTLPRLHALAAVGRSLHDYDQVILASTPQPFHLQSLAALGLPPERVVTRAAAGPRFHCEAFDFVTPVRLGYVAEPWVYEAVGRLFAPPVPAERRRKLFISRRNARRRRIVGEEGLHPLLRARGYEIINAEDYALGDMARLCAQAEAIVGPHGAGIANAVFSPPGARLLEIFGAHISAEYWRVASQRGLVYAVAQGRDTSGQPFRETELTGLGLKARKEADMSLSADEFEGLLEAFERL